MFFVVSRDTSADAVAALWTRGSLFGCLFLLGVANGLLSVAMAAVNALGWHAALLAGFNISSIVWIASGASLLMYDWRADLDPPSRFDLLLAVGCVSLMLAPVGWMSWLAVTWLGVGLLRLRGLHPVNRTAAIILLAITVPMVWSKLVFHIFAAALLHIDAWLVALVVGTTRTGNMLRFVDGSGYLVVFPACSSLTNMSLAGLSWILVAKLAGHRWSRRDVWWIASICMVVIGANVGRMSLMALSVRQYAIWHSAPGEALANACVTVAVVGLSLMGVRHDIA